MPKFSVLIPSYNRPEFLRIAVASALASDYPDFEVVVSDDCSPRQAEIRAVLAPLLADPRLRYHEQPTNLREPANRGFLQEVARGEWLVYLGDDDTLDSRALGVLSRYIAANPGVELFTFGYRLVDQEGRECYRRRVPREMRIHRDAGWVLAEFLYSDAFPYWFYQPATFCAHREVGSRVKPNNSVGMGDDLLFLFDYVNAGGTILVIPDVLMAYRKIDPTVTGVQGNQSTAHLANVSTRYRIMRELEQRDDLCAPMRAIIGTETFRARFVYHGVAHEVLQPSDVAAAVAMSATHAEELAWHYRRRGRVLTRLAGYLRRAGVFTRLFGVPGMVEISRVALQRALSRTR